MKLPLDDIQSLVFTGHGTHPQSLVLGLSWAGSREGLLDGSDNSPRAILQALLNEKIAFGKRLPRAGLRVQLGLSAAGMRKLFAVQEDELRTVSAPFAEGMSVPKRSRALGDYGRNDTAAWGWSDAGIDLVLMLYATKDADMNLLGNELLAFIGADWQCRYRQMTHLPEQSREPFGFRDGIASTKIDSGSTKELEPNVDQLPTGEVLLGEMDATQLQRPVPQFATHATLLVLRGLEQDVAGFWKFWLAQANGDEQRAVWLASKAVGRWPNGMPMASVQVEAEPAADEARILSGPRFADDRSGEKIPVGSHVRRANPRDSLTADGEQSQSIVDLHRILRRGRVFGSAAPASAYPSSLSFLGVAGEPDFATSDKRGLIFACLCGDITRQFEFVQQTWLNQPKFANQYDGIDPIAGGDGIVGDNKHFIIPRPSLRLRLKEVQGWVRVSGGGYFLMPSRPGLQSLIDSLPDS